MIGALLETILLIMNAVAILNEKRFLKKCTSCPYVVDGFDTSSATSSNSNTSSNPNDTITSKSQIIMMVFTLRSMGKCMALIIFVDILIPLNLLAILLEVLGWEKHDRLWLSKLHFFYLMRQGRQYLYLTFWLKEFESSVWVYRFYSNQQRIACLSRPLTSVIYQKQYWFLLSSPFNFAISNAATPPASRPLSSVKYIHRTSRSSKSSP